MAAFQICDMVALATPVLLARALWEKAMSQSHLTQALANIRTNIPVLVSAGWRFGNAAKVASTMQVTSLAAKGGCSPVQYSKHFTIGTRIFNELWG